MARRRKKGGSRKKGIRVAALVGMIAGTYMLANRVYKAAPELRVEAAVRALTGWSLAAGNFRMARAEFLIPVVAGTAVSMVASKVGLNRYTPKGINI